MLVATDLSPASHAAVAEGARIARETGARVTLLYVFDTGQWALPPDVPQSTLRRIADEATGAAMSVLGAMRERYYTGLPDVELRTAEHSSAAQAICTCARSWGVDLIIVGSHGRTGPSFSVIGSVTEKVVRAAPSRVLVVPCRDAADFAH